MTWMDVRDALKAGKTTAISLMLGLRRATVGEVRLFGLPLATAAQRGQDTKKQDEVTSHV